MYIHRDPGPDCLHPFPTAHKKILAHLLQKTPFTKNKMYLSDGSCGVKSKDFKLKARRLISHLSFQCRF